MKCFESLAMRHIKKLLAPSLDPMQFVYHPNRPNLSIQHNHSSTSDQESESVGHQHFPLQLDPGLPDWETSVSPDRKQYLRLISKNDESAYREEVRLTAWCKANNLPLNVEKTKEMVVDLRRAQSGHSPLNIDGSNVEIVKSTKFLSVHLAEDLIWSLNTSSITKKAQQQLYFLQRLRKAHIPPPILTTFYRGTIESILSSCITAWFVNCTVSDHKTLQRIVRTAEKIFGVSSPSITDIYSTRCICKANSIVDNPTHPLHTLFTLLPSGKSTCQFHIQMPTLPASVTYDFVLQEFNIIFEKT
ncbi:hypothetical protein QTP70_008809 [Hemibagrus guttatus]|uniref:Alkylated DNA repair protein AlkB homologue 8 N-terminal domain-containing protein n=1 Tax=Hemibagrus guttatus TaxID=175788 RepID=A0AAE0QUL2_9TELE|nr:hypothetical protein QTP70_008809 [Hemibagrus guttatus]KAK3561481.1 hypothetical protein QTP86_003906 [Hemibagrus guttatus]